MTHELSDGTVHKMPDDLKVALLADNAALKAWEDISPLARNEWICWVENAKLIDTRNRRISRTASELAEGMRRPCCWPGCMHRTDKPLSSTQKWLQSKEAQKNK